MAYDENIYARIITNKISPEEKEALIASGEWEEIQRILNISENLKLPKHDNNTGYAALKKQRNRKVGSGPKTRNLWPMLMGIAASIALLLVFLIGFGSNNTTEVKALLAQNESHILPDGSAVVLNDGSSIKHGQKDWLSERQLKLKGEAYFSVQPGNKFQVLIDKGTVSVLGTQFNVRAWGDQLYVECYEGQVEVHSKKNKTTLSAMQALKVVAGVTQPTVTINHLKPSWTVGTSRFHEEPLKEVFRELERQFNVKLSMPADNRQFSGSFNDKDLDLALAQICEPMNLNYEILDNSRVIIKK